MNFQKKCVFLSTVIAFSFITSCKNAADNKLSYSESETIKQIVKDKETSISWTKEIEGRRLTEQIVTAQNAVAEGTAVTPDLLKILPDASKATYPILEEFGSLDTTKLTESVREVITSFAKALSEDFYNAPQAYIASEYIFNYVFFRNDFMQGWQTAFNETFPAKDNEPLQKQKLFSDVMIGEPFMSQKMLQIPVRFYCKHGSVDVTLYLTNQADYKIYQITINRWEKYDRTK